MGETASPEPGGDSQWLPSVWAVIGLCMLALSGIKSCENGADSKTILKQNAEIQAAVIEIRQRLPK